MDLPQTSNGNKKLRQEKVRKPHHRRSYSCGPCKHHKTKCDHAIPCYSCQRYRREHLCLQSPATPPVPKQPRTKRLRIIESTPAMLMRGQQSSIEQVVPSKNYSETASFTLIPSQSINASSGLSTTSDHISNQSSHQVNNSQREPLGVVTSMPHHAGLKPLLEHPTLPTPYQKSECDLPTGFVFTTNHHPTKPPASYLSSISDSKNIASGSLTPTTNGQGDSQDSLNPFNAGSNSTQATSVNLTGHPRTPYSIQEASNPNIPTLATPSSGSISSTFQQFGSPAYNSLPRVTSYPDPTILVNSLSSASPSMSVSPFPQLANDNHHTSLPIAAQHSSQFQNDIPSNPHPSFQVNDKTSREDSATILRLKDQVGYLEGLVSKLSGIASFSYANTSAEAAKNTDSDIAYQGPIFDVWNMTSSEFSWKIILLRALPTSEQCRVYVDYYFEYVDYIYHPLHNITFLKELESFWADDSDKDMIWLSILFMILSLSSLHLPKDIAKKLNVNDLVFSLSQASNLWFRASRQALQAGGFDEKPKFQQLQTFSLTQLYLYATNQTELLNSLLGQAIRHAQVLGLHSDTPGANCIETQLRRRIWWDICGCDTFQSLCMGRPSLVNSYDSSVPFPLNCHEEDMTPTEIKQQPENVPTIMSFQIQRNLVIKILNQLNSNVDGVRPSFQAVLKTDKELHDYIKSMPWYFCISNKGELANGFFGKTDKLPRKMDYIHFQAHILHICLCIHRVRIHQQFLQQKVRISWDACLSSVRSTFAVYRQLRRHFGGVGENYKFIIQIHQAFSGAVAQGLFLLVEKPSEEDAIILRRDVDTFIDDLRTLMKSFFVAIPILTDGINELSRIRDMINKGTNPEKSSKVISGVYSVFGGKKVTESYLERCSIDYVVNSDGSRPPNSLSLKKATSSLDNLRAQLNSSQQVQCTSDSINSGNSGPISNNEFSAVPSEQYFVANIVRDTSSTARMMAFPSQDDVIESLKIHSQQALNSSNDADNKSYDLLSLDSYFWCVNRD